jgi:F-type H+-transporting ATPase subunit c
MVPMKLAQLFFVVVAVFLILACPVLAQAPAGERGTSYVLSGNGIGAGIGAALTIIGAGYGFGRIGSSALESMARQPEVAGRVQTAMLIIAALLEGATFFALIIVFTIAGRTGAM